MVRSKIFFLFFCLLTAIQPCTLNASEQELLNRFCTKYLQGPIKKFSFSALVSSHWKSGIRIPEAGFIPFSVCHDLAPVLRASCSSVGGAFLITGLLQYLWGKPDLKEKALSQYSKIEQKSLTTDQFKVALENEELLKRARLETIHSLVLGALCITTGYALDSALILGAGGRQLILSPPKDYKLVRFSIQNPN